MISSEDYDKKLWFEHKGCEGKHFILGNPHTFPGRIWAWCPVKNGSFFVSKSEIGNTSEQAAYWIKGFLSGNEPEPPVDENGDVDFESNTYREWTARAKEFSATGTWPRE